MQFAYLRVSTQDKQDFDRQLYVLRTSGYDIPERNIFCDRATGKNTDREQYQLLKKIVRQGDVIVLPELARFSRNYNEIASEMLYFQQAEVKLIFLDMPYLNTETNDLTQQLITDITIKLFSYVAQIERENISKRIKQKLDSMKQDGIKLGRPAIILSPEQTAILEIYVLKKEGCKTSRETAEDMGLKIDTFFKIVRKYRQEHNISKAGEEVFSE